MHEPTPDLTDADRWLQWYLAARAGDQEAEAKLLGEVRPFFRAEVQKHSRGQAFGASDGSDVAQECCLKLKFLQPGQEFRGTTGRDFLSWLRTMAYHEFLDNVRAGKAQKRGGGQLPARLPGDSTGEVAIAAETSTPSQRAVRQEEHEQLEAALAGLPDEHQRVISLRRSADKLTWADIAREMGRTEDAVKQLFRRAVNRLSEELRGRA
jgi:RNA polymerase sigma factor (sigma-70 family)